MDRGSLIFRTVVVAVVVTVFAWSMHPLVEKDYYEVFRSVVDNAHSGTADNLIAAAKTLEKDKGYPAPRALELATELVPEGRDLKKILKESKKKNIENNRDVLNMVRKEASGSIRLGLDLAGGVEFYLKLEELKNLEPEKKRDIEENFDRYRDVAIEILRKRLEAEKIFEAEIAPSGDRHVVLRAPVVSSYERLKLQKLIADSASLEFRLVLEDSDAEIKRNREEFRRIQPNGSKLDERLYLIDHAPPGSEFMWAEEKVKSGIKVNSYYVYLEAQMDGKNVVNAYPDKDQWGNRQIILHFNAQGAADFERVTGSNVGRQLAIVLDGKLCCAPVIRDKIPGGNAVISGSFSEEEVKFIADALVSGSFPFQIKVVAVFDTAPTLGKANVRNGILVGIISLICVAVFMIVYYRLCGVISIVALVLNVVMIMGAMAAFGSTLTLPGIAGIILTIGMAVDANVLVFERIREELANGHKLRTAVDMGYSRAFSAVFDANVTTLLTSVILMYVGTGAVKGFGVTLSIGILSTLFTALFVTRLIFDYILKFTRLEHISMLQIFKNAKYPFMKIFRWALLASVLLVIALTVTLAVRGRSVLGIDFTGGTSLSFSYDENQQVPQERIKALLQSKKYDEPKVLYKENLDPKAETKRVLEITIRGELKRNGDEVAEDLQKAFPDAKFIRTGDSQNISGLIGREFIKAALYAIVLSLIGIGVYISLRYEFIYAVSGVLMLMHDVAVVLAIYLMAGRTLSLTAIAALLTVIGYSINDNVVIFDRMRENIKLGVSKNFGEIAELAINQTLSRTVITSITTFIVVFIQFVAGSEAINDFVFIMMLGVVLGTYSSVFLAAPTVVFLRSRGEKKQHQSRKAEAKKC